MMLHNNNSSTSSKAAAPTITRDVESEIKKSFQSINYSQWERQTKQQQQQQQQQKLPQTSMLTVQQPAQIVDPEMGVLVATRSTGLPPSKKAADPFSLPERKCSARCNHVPSDGEKTPQRRVYKTARQLEEERYVRNMLKTKIKYTKEELAYLKKREKELTSANEKLQNFIMAHEKATNDKADEIIHKYERYRNVVHEINKKHFEELKVEQESLNRLKKTLDEELPKHALSSYQIDEELSVAQELHKELAIYKNQEYPEKLLQINNLKKTLDDLVQLNEEELNEHKNMINKERARIKKEQQMSTFVIADRISQKSMDAMHYSLKDMARYNESLKTEIAFHKAISIKLKKEIAILEKEVKVCEKKKCERELRQTAFSELCAKKEICTPDMEIELNIPRKKPLPIF